MSPQPCDPDRGTPLPEGAQEAPGAAQAHAEVDTTIRAVVFDMDGVLLNSEGAWLQARRDYARSLGRVCIRGNGRIRKHPGLGQGRLELPCRSSGGKPQSVADSTVDRDQFRPRNAPVLLCPARK
uniref:Uncharacterized protein n=1 Tax=mine drainage metagenome TaxID=410659 RepID=E6PTR8_9ZZZZ